MAKFNFQENRKVLFVGILAVVLIILAVIFYTGGTREKIRRLADDSVSKPSPSPGPKAAMKTVTLFFLSEGDDLLHREERDIPEGLSVADEAERVLAELIRGSEKDMISPLPPEAKVRQVFVTDDGVAFVDFSREIMERSSYGSSSELAAVFAVVNTLAANFKSIKRVAILVEGGERDTLGGHIDLTKPFVPNFSLVAR